MPRLVGYTDWHPTHPSLRKPYWMYQKVGDKMLVYLSDEAVAEMRRDGFTIEPYDPRTGPRNAARDATTKGK